MKSLREFLGFTSLNQMDAETIAGTIVTQCKKYGLTSNKVHDQGYEPSTNCFELIMLNKTQCVRHEQKE
ncbi:hypothetical protein DPMN_159637 [Dreissena polymorpha]|uniref:Uncharacterized protein n=1 Tax=Dreissena polymorpha TaxID=45954 RepID=A0A9D4ELB2_DREPO|nr:hypothetical protein DPMN_159637 [Dreissena polymorpha]